MVEKNIQGFGGTKLFVKEYPTFSLQSYCTAVSGVKKTNFNIAELIV